MARNRLRGNFLSGMVTDNPLLVAATTLNSAGLAALPAVANNDYMALTLDPSGSAGSPEIVYVTAHTALATSATILRGQEGTGARQHAQNVQWINSPTTVEFQGTNFDANWNRGTTAHALDDEFNDGSLDAAWLRYDNNANSTVWTEGKDVLSVYNPGSDTADKMSHILAKSLGGISFPLTIEAGFRFMRRYAANYEMFGLCMTDGLVSASRGIWQMPFANTGVATAFSFSTRTWTGIGTSTSVNPTTDQTWEAPNCPALYMKMRWSAANTFQTSYSPDGVSWFKFPTADVSYTLTPTHAGFCISTWGGTTPVIGSVEYFRVVQA